MTMFAWIRIAAVTLCAALLATPANALTEYTLTGTVTTLIDHSEGLFTGAFSVGSSYSATIILDETETDADPDPAFGDYRGALVSYDITLGAYSSGTIFPSSWIFDASVENDTEDVFIIEDGTLANPALDSMPPRVTRLLTLVDHDATVWGSDARPTDFPSGLAHFETAQATLIWEQGGTLGVDAVVTLDGISAASIPEPGTAALVGIGLVCTRLRRTACLRCTPRARGASVHRGPSIARSRDAASYRARQAARSPESRCS
jgi:hypothetical protein